MRDDPYCTDKALRAIARAQQDGRRSPTNEEFIRCGAARHTLRVAALLRALVSAGKIVVTSKGRGRTIRLNHDTEVELSRMSASDARADGSCYDDRPPSGFDRKTRNAMVIAACLAAGVKNPVIPPGVPNAKGRSDD